MNTCVVPTLHALSQRLRELHTAWAHPDAGGEYVQLRLATDGTWHVTPYALTGEHSTYGREWIPGDGRPFDATAAARRLLAAANQGSAMNVYPTRYEREDGIAAVKRRETDTWYLQSYVVNDSHYIWDHEAQMWVLRNPHWSDDSLVLQPCFNRPLEETLKALSEVEPVVPKRVRHPNSRLTYEQVQELQGLANSSIGVACGTTNLEKRYRAILDSLVELGMAQSEGETFTVTEKGRAEVDRIRVERSFGG